MATSFLLLVARIRERSREINLPVGNLCIRPTVREALRLFAERASCRPIPSTRLRPRSGLSYEPPAEFEGELRPVAQTANQDKALSLTKRVSTNGCSP